MSSKKRGWPGADYPLHDMSAPSYKTQCPLVLVLLCQVGSALAQVSPSGTNTPPDEKAMLERAVAVRPTPRQLEWQRREIHALVHFGMNTFTGRSWGTGGESPPLFNPTNLDCQQWVLAAQSFGARSITLTCKHHDGFCLWPSQFTEHSVKQSPWRNGQGDVVRELSDACRKAGLGFGVYLSPADLHEPTHLQASAKYNDYFCNQLRELLTEYGEVCEVFLDGAQPSRGFKTYDFQRYYRLIRELQPKAVISMRGPDVRWVGNELGFARETEWSVIPLTVPPDKQTWPDLTALDLGSRERIQAAPYLHWYPAAADVSLRDAWFWVPGRDHTIKPLKDLLRTYEFSVGRNAVLQLNLSPDRTGRIPEPDMKRLQEFGLALRSLFATNLLASATIEPLTSKDEGVLIQRAPLPCPQKLRYVVLQEDITKGQRVEEFEIALTLENGQQKSFRGTTIGCKRIINLGSLSAGELLLRITRTRAAPSVTISAF